MGVALAEPQQMANKTARHGMWHLSTCRMPAPALASVACTRSRKLLQKIASVMVLVIDEEKFVS